MSIKQVLIAILNMFFRLSISCIVVLLIYRAAMYSYHFGYMVFSDAAMEISPGRDVSITVETDDEILDIGETLERRGLISDAKIFLVQAYLLEYNDKLLPGVYTLNTSMKSEEMLEIMAAMAEEGTDGESEEEETE
ncbi:MAG: endolytic transglycosylase MltG [Lachnospiraceae bacterium]|nr:endolytic transglycosylase MltG [Lachnospiraceae bacterium]